MRGPAAGRGAVVEKYRILEGIRGKAPAPIVIERLVASRVIVASEGIAGEEQIEVAHEMLLQTWPRLVQWRKEDAEGAHLREQLRTAAAQWEARAVPAPTDGGIRLAQDADSLLNRGWWARPAAGASRARAVETPPALAGPGMSTLSGGRRRRAGGRASPRERGRARGGAKRRCEERHRPGRRRGPPDREAPGPARRSWT